MVQVVWKTVKLSKLSVHVSKNTVVLRQKTKITIMSSIIKAEDEPPF